MQDRVRPLDEPCFAVHRPCFRWRWGSDSVGWWWFSFLFFFLQPIQPGLRGRKPEPEIGFNLIANLKSVAVQVAQCFPGHPGSAYQRWGRDLLFGLAERLEYPH